jgi:extradiol dioxygenase family protein
MDVQVIYVSELVPMRNHEPKKMLEITTTALITEEELWSRVMGVAWQSYDWWASAEYLDGADWDKPGAIRVNGEFYPKGHTGGITITVHDLAYALERMNFSQSTIDILSDNADCSSADELMQVAVFGEVIYS